MKDKILPLIILFFLASCSGMQHSKQEIEAAMQQYDRLIKKVDADSIALLYTVDGDLGEMAHGRDSIRHFLAGFKNVKIVDVASTTDSLTINKDTAFQSGHYHQDGVINGNDSFHVKGSYHVRWTWIDKEGWKIKKITTHPEG